MDRMMLPCERGPLDGAEKPYSASGFHLEVTDSHIHRYLVKQTAEGWMYWEHFEVLPLTARQQA